MHPHVYSNGHICASILGEIPPPPSCLTQIPDEQVRHRMVSWCATIHPARALADPTSVLTAMAICITIQSMLASCKKKER